MQLGWAAGAALFFAGLGEGQEVLQFQLGLGAFASIETVKRPDQLRIEIRRRQRHCVVALLLVVGDFLQEPLQGPQGCLQEPLSGEVTSQWAALQTDVEPVEVEGLSANDLLQLPQLLLQFTPFVLGG